MAGPAAVFLDRDGTLMEDVHYPKDPREVRIFPYVPDALKEMRSKGYLLFVVSNQSGVGRGIISRASFHAVHERFCALLMQAGITLDDFAYCLHAPEDHCRCRKPATGLLRREFRGQEIDYTRSVVVGDKRSDLELAWNAQLFPYLVRTGKGAATEGELGEESRPFQVADNLSEVSGKLPRINR